MLVAIEPQPERSHDHSEPLYPGLDFDQSRKLLAGVDSLAWCFDCDPSRIRRWAKRGTMAKPLKVGGRTL
jgi:hypothetical protein